MSYPRDLDEYSEQEIRRELVRREERNSRGVCDYCNKALGSVPVCRFPKRHGMCTAERTVNRVTYRCTRVAGHNRVTGDPNQPFEPTLHAYGNTFLWTD